METADMLTYKSVLSGCWDGPFLHQGHVKLLSLADRISDEVCVLVNSDSYVTRNKHREPYVNQDARLERILKSGYVTEARIFEEDSPLEIIKEIRPDFILASQDYLHSDVKGWPECLSWGGRVILCELVKDRTGNKISTSDLIKQVRKNSYSVVIKAGQQIRLKRKTESLVICNTSKNIKLT